MSFNWRVSLTFSGLGPPIGALIWILVIGVYSQSFDVLHYLCFALVISWLIGFIPAALAGFILAVLWRGTLRSRTSASHRAFSAAAVGALCTTSYILVVFSYELSYALAMAATGAISAGICGLIVRRDWLHSDPPRRRPTRTSRF